jgi:hypothetical protein
MVLTDLLFLVDDHQPRSWNIVNVESFYQTVTMRNLDNLAPERSLLTSRCDGFCFLDLRLAVEGW